MVARRLLTVGLGLGMATALASAQSAGNAGDSVRRWAPLLGTWEYRQANQAAPGGLDPEGERLEIRLRGATPQGLYFGLERTGDHGLFYTATAVTGLAKSSDERLSFTVPSRRLFSRRPTTIADGERMGDGAGFTREALQFNGRIRRARLELECAGSGCPDSVMVFSKVP